MGIRTEDQAFPVFDTLLLMEPGPYSACAAGIVMARRSPTRETRVVLLPVEPFRVHAYWDTSAGALRRAEKALGKEAVHAWPVLRFYEASNGFVSRTKRQGHFDIAVRLEEKRCYVPLWRAGGTYWAELGLITQAGRFLPLAKSNVARTPRPVPRDLGQGSRVAHRDSPSDGQRHEPGFRLSEGPPAEGTAGFEESGFSKKTKTVFRLGAPAVIAASNLGKSSPDRN